MARYILFGDKIRSPKDGDIHYISPVKLLGLYNLDPKDCILLPDGHDSSALLGVKETDYIILGPRTNGDYIEHLMQVTINRQPRGG